MATTRNYLRSAVAALLLGTLLAACGDGVLIISFNSGTVVGNPICRNGGGQFDLRDQGGLLVLVVITSNTVIFTSGGFAGTCNDITPAARVQVRGHRDSTGITAQSVQLQ